MVLAVKNLPLPRTRGSWALAGLLGWACAEFVTGLAEDLGELMAWLDAGVFGQAKPAGLRSLGYTGP